MKLNVYIIQRIKFVFSVSSPYAMFLNKQGAIKKSWVYKTFHRSEKAGHGEWTEPTEKVTTSRSSLRFSGFLRTVAVE